MDRTALELEVRRIAGRINGALTTDRLDVSLAEETLAMERVRAASLRAYAHVLQQAAARRTELLLRGAV